MSVNRQKIQSLLSRLAERFSVEQIEEKLSSKNGAAPARLKHAKQLDAGIIEQNWETLREQTSLTESDQQVIADPVTISHIHAYSKNIENCIGTLKIPVGVAGPLRINGLFAQGDYYVPMATTEAALVASYSRGASLITAAGGCTAMTLNEGISRAPGFIFKNLIEVSQFILWANHHFDDFVKMAENTTRHGKLLDISYTVEGNHVYVTFDYITGDASGQNMSTIATAAILGYIAEHSPVKPSGSFIDGNFSGDKKASALSYLSVRGKKVTAEVSLSRDLVEKYLHTTPETLANYWRLAALGGVMSGTMGVQAHFANGLAALYLATGQDAACVAESSVGITRLELTKDEGLYATVTLPNIIVGSVGGGTALPSQSVGLKMLGLQGEGCVHALAEVCASICLAGELSIMGAMCAGDFASAHARLARGKKEP